MLQPNDPDSYYQHRELVPKSMLNDLQRAKIVITNFHAFKLRERLDVSSNGRRLLQGRGEPLATQETEGQMLQRVMPELMGMKNIMVLNDEAHHCYREKAGESDESKPKNEDLEEAKKNREAARLWIAGLEAARRKLGLNRVVDLSATPFFLRGSGYAEGTLFPWTMSDFSLMDAIECGIVKLPRVPVADNLPADTDMPKLRVLWDHIGKDMPKRPQQNAATLDSLRIPTMLDTALSALYGHYEKTFELWQDANISVPPCFIIVCNNTATSKLVRDYVSGFHRTSDDGAKTLENGRLALFRNFDEQGNPFPRPRTLLIDSKQLESDEPLGKEFRSAAADQIDRFRRDIIERTGRPAPSRKDRRPGPPARSHEHRGQAGTIGRLGPLRSVGIHAHRRLGRQHRYARPGRPRLQHATALRTGRRQSPPPAVLRPRRERPVPRGICRRPGHSVRLHRQTRRRLAHAAKRDHPGQSRPSRTRPP